MRFLKLPLFFTSFFILSIGVSHAQILNKLRYNPYIKSHAFFDDGSHKLSDKNNAWCKGAGVNIFWQAKPKISFSMGYGLGFIDSLKYKEDFTHLADFHQVDVNIIYAPFNKHLIQPALFFGYAFNYIPQLKEFENPTFGTNVNLGFSAEFRVKSYVNLRYANTYAFSLSEQIRHNFKHELGLVYNLNNFKSKATIKEISEYKAIIEQDLAVYEELENNRDSLEKFNEIITAKTTENYKLQETISLIVEQYNILSLDKTLAESSNLLLNDSIAKLLFFRDTVITVSKVDFYIIDSDGEVESTLSPNFSNGYYLVAPNFLTYDDALLGQRNSEVFSLGTSFILYHNGFYIIFSYLTKNKDELINKWRDLGEVPAYFKIYKF